MTAEEFEQKQAEMSNEELIKLADKQVIELASTGGSSHKMSVPPQITDTDMIFCELIKRFKVLIAELEKPLPTDEQIEQYALENILDGVGIQSMINTKSWIAGARWMRNLIQERREK